MADRFEVAHAPISLARATAVRHINHEQFVYNTRNFALRKGQQIHIATTLPTAFTIQKYMLFPSTTTISAASAWGTAGWRVPATPVPYGVFCFKDAALPVPEILNFFPRLDQCYTRAETLTEIERAMTESFALGLAGAYIAYHVHIVDDNKDMTLRIEVQDGAHAHLTDTIYLVYRPLQAGSSPSFESVTEKHDLWEVMGFDKSDPSGTLTNNNANITVVDSLNGATFNPPTQQSTSYGGVAGWSVASIFGDFNEIWLAVTCHELAPLCASSHDAFSLQHLQTADGSTRRLENYIDSVQLVSAVKAYNSSSTYVKPILISKHDVNVPTMTIVAKTLQGEVVALSGYPQLKIELGHTLT